MDLYVHKYLLKTEYNMLFSMTDNTRVDEVKRGRIYAKVLC